MHRVRAPASGADASCRGAPGSKPPASLPWLACASAAWPWPCRASCPCHSCAWNSYGDGRLDRGMELIIHELEILILIFKDACRTAPDLQSRRRQRLPAQLQLGLVPGGGVKRG